jgi:hypothetical protein
MEAGEAKVRRRTTSGVMPLSLAYRMTSAEKEDFEDWVASDIADGALRFTLPDPEADSGTIEVRMTGGNGTPLYSIVPDVPGHWVISFAAEVMPA